MLASAAQSVESSHELRYWFRAALARASPYSAATSAHMAGSHIAWKWATNPDG